MLKSARLERSERSQGRLLRRPTSKKFHAGLTFFANAEDEATGEAVEVYRFPKVSRGYGTIRIPRDQAYFDPKATARMIVAKNGMLPRDLEKAIEIAKAASKADPREHWLEIAAEGWRPDMSAFIHSGHVIGQDRVGRLRLKAPSNTRRSYILARKGHLSGTMRMLRIARHSSRMRLGVCAAFAAPLLKVVDLQSFMLVIAGRSKAGKSTVLLALASIIGIGREGGLPNFNATGASLQEVAADFNDSVLPVNEIALLKGNKRDAYQSLRPLIFRYAEGRDTGRHTKSTYASETGAASWRGIMVASSENTIEALAEMAGETRDEGEYARAFDVPAVRFGHPTVFDRFPRRVAPHRREAWARRQLAEIRKLCNENHGLVFHRYVKFLTQHHTTLKDDTERAMGIFLDSLDRTTLSGAQQHAARNFALLYAGAVMAKKAGMLPWGLAKTRDALKKCFMDGLQEISRIEGAECRARDALLQNISKLGILSESTVLRDVEGWFEETERGKLYSVKSPCFKKWFDTPEEQRAALRWLHQMRLLDLKKGARCELPNTEWATKFARVGGKGQRCYKFRYPRTEHASSMR